MDIFNMFFGRKENHPPLDPGSTAARRLEPLTAQLETLVKRVHDYIEIVPAGDTAYVYVGKPPGTFGLVWFENGVKLNFRFLARNKGLSQRRIQALSAGLGEAYARNSAARRFSFILAGREVVVTPCDPFADEIKAIIHEASS